MIDFNSGYRQIPCTNSTKPLLAFSPGYGFGQWACLREIKLASSKFQQTMEKTFASHQHCILPPFYDDTIIKEMTFHDHVNNVIQILTHIREYGLTLNALKCKFFQTKLPYLDHIIDNGSIRIDPSRIQAITGFPTPQDVKSLRHFLSMAQFCECFISNFSVISAPLHDLTKPNVPYVWSKKCQEAFTTIKDLLTSAPVLWAPDSHDYFILGTDASDKGKGVCLKARSHFDHQEYIVAYGSHKFDATEER